MTGVSQFYIFLFSFSIIVLFSCLILPVGIPVCCYNLTSWAKERLVIEGNDFGLIVALDTIVRAVLPLLVLC